MILSTHGIVGSQILQASGLLIDYPGAAAAYSLRLLRTNYTGSAIRVRRANDNTEENIGFDSNGNLDTAFLTSFCSGTNGFVKTWYDQSGNGRDATQTTAVNQPKIYDSTGGYLTYIDFIATNGVSLLSSYIYENTINFTSFGVVQNYGASVFGGANSSGAFYNVAQMSSTDASFSNFTTPTIYKNGTSIGTTRGNIYTATTSKSLLTTLSKNSNAVLNFNLQFGYPYSGALQYIRFFEFLIYNNQTISRTGVESNIMTYYGL